MALQETDSTARVDYITFINHHSLRDRCNIDKQDASNNNYSNKLNAAWTPLSEVIYMQDDIIARLFAGKYSLRTFD